MKFEFNSLITPIFKFITWPAKENVSDTKLKNQIQFPDIMCWAINDVQHARFS